MNTTGEMMAALLSLRGKKAELPSLPDEPPLTAKDVAEAVAEAFGRFADADGKLKVRAPYMPYGGG